MVEPGLLDLGRHFGERLTAVLRPVLGRLDGSRLLILNRRFDIFANRLLTGCVISGTL